MQDSTERRAASVYEDVALLTHAGMAPSEEQLQAMRTGRNDPCPCGSHKKFKKCCLSMVDTLTHRTRLLRQLGKIH